MKKTSWFLIGFLRVDREVIEHAKVRGERMIERRTMKIFDVVFGAIVAQQRRHLAIMRLTHVRKQVMRHCDHEGNKMRKCTEKTKKHYANLDSWARQYTSTSYNSNDRSLVWLPIAFYSSPYSIYLLKKWLTSCLLQKNSIFGYVVFDTVFVGFWKFSFSNTMITLKQNSQIQRSKKNKIILLLLFIVSLLLLLPEPISAQRVNKHSPHRHAAIPR